MDTQIKPRQSQLIILLMVALLTLYQLVRIIVFVNQYGGIEHDGGWILSISRSLAEQGTYTTMVSTIIDPDVPGAVNVDQKFDIQTTDGRIWFFTGNGIGPASIIPEAVILKIFGTDFWALRAGPLIFYTLFLLLAAIILYRLAGLGAVVLLHAFLFFYPHLSIFLSYEAMGEVPALVYVLWAYLAFIWAAKSTGQQRLRFFGAGLIIGLALTTKLIALWSISGIFIWAGLLWLVDWLKSLPIQWKLKDVGWPHVKLTSGQLLSLAGGAALPVVMWEFVHVVVLTRFVGFDLYLRHTQQRITFILDDGSGVGQQIHSGSEFFWDKFFLLTEVTHPQRWVTVIIFVAVMVGGGVLLWYWRNRADKQNLLALMWLGWLANTVWFVALAKTGWPRHFWFGLILTAMLVSIICVAFIGMGIQGLRRAGYKLKRAVAPLPVGLLLLLLVGWGFISQPHIWGFFLPDDIVSHWQEKQINNKYHASLPWMIIPRAEQAVVVDYIKRMPAEAKVYFPNARKSAEIPVQTGRVQYTLNRRNYVDPHPADVVLIGPAIISPWKDPIQRQDLLQLIEQQCPHPAIQNDYYMICPFADNPPQP